MEALKELFSELFGSSEVSLELFSGGMGIVAYILQGIALYAIAKRRGISKPWLAWVPFGNVWILGSVSDQYRYVTSGEVKNKRKWLLGLDIACGALAAVLAVVVIWLLVDVILVSASAPLFWDGHIDPALWDALSDQIVVLLLLVLLAIPLCALGVIRTVFLHMSLFDLYRSCDPKNNKWMFAISLVGSLDIPGLYSIMLMICKDKELGMPPRKPEAISEPEKTEE